MKFFKKRSLQKQLSQFWGQYDDHKKISDQNISQLSDLLSNKEIPLSDIDHHTYLWIPLFNTLARHKFSDDALSLMAVALQHGLPVTDKAVLHVADKLDNHCLVSSVAGVEDVHYFPVIMDTNFADNPAGLKKMLNLLSAFNAPWTSTPYHYGGYTGNVAQYLATKTIEDPLGLGRKQEQVFCNFFKQYANPDQVSTLNVDAILDKRREEQFASEPDEITIVTTKSAQPGRRL